MRQYVELIEEIDPSVNGRHVFAALYADISEGYMSRHQIVTTIAELPIEAFEEFIELYKVLERDMNRANRRRWQKGADKWARQNGL